MYWCNIDVVRGDAESYIYVTDPEVGAGLLHLLAY